MQTEVTVLVQARKRERLRGGSRVVEFVGRMYMAEINWLDGMDERAWKGREG